MKKMILICLAATLLVSGMFAGQAFGQKTQLRWLSWATAPFHRASYEPMLEKFEAEYPGIKVTEVLAPYDQHVQIHMRSAVTDDLPEMYFADAGHINFLLSAGFMEPFNKYLTRVDIASKPESAWGLAMRRGVILGIPFNYDFEGLFYNDRVLKASGIDGQTDLMTWSDLFAAARKLTKDTDGDGKNDQYGFDHTMDANHHIFKMINQFLVTNSASVLRQDGEEYYSNIKSPRVVESVKAWLSLKSYEPPEMGGYDYVTALAAIGDRIVGMGLSSCSLGGYFYGDYGVLKDRPWHSDIRVLPFPAGPNGDREVGAMGCILSVNRKASDEKKEAAATFLMWMNVEHEMEVDLGAWPTGYIAMYSLVNKFKVPAYRDQLKIVTEGYCFPIEHPVNFSVKEWEGIRLGWAENMASVWTGAKELMFALDEYDKEIERMLVSGGREEVAPRGGWEAYRKAAGL